MGRPQSLGGSGEAARIDDGTQRAQGGELIHQRAAPVGRTRDVRALPAYQAPPPALRTGSARIASVVMTSPNVSSIWASAASCSARWPMCWPPARSRSRLAVEADDTITR
ncbi:hypothetical protein G6F46_014752 [Rhizopus delemar]|nr:hypothetical protein G6F46_014752 [Rhizopus delemar]